MAVDVSQLVDFPNIADGIDAETLARISIKVIDGYKADDMSRKSWLNRSRQWMKLATQVIEEKTFPWDGASNVKYPLLTIAAVQFAARAYPALIPNNNIAKGLVIGYDPDGSKAVKAEKIGKHMSFQFMEEIPDWEDGMDKLCIILPVLGCVFKKTYQGYDGPRSEVVLAENLVVDYYAQSLESSSRVTHVLYLTKNQVRERQLMGLFRDVDLNGPATPPTNVQNNSETLPPPPDDESTPYTILEQHRWLDLDEDGYEEPYIVTVEEASGEVLRVVARFDAKGITRNDKGKVARIEPVHYFTKFSFIPNPDGGFYDLGFGNLVGPLNETCNTIINQLIDAGTLSNLQSGLLGRGIRMKGGIVRLKPGEWKVVDSTGDDLHKNVFPMPVREPSAVLFQLLGSLIEGGQKVGSATDPFAGEMPGQNTPATTTMAVIEQGMKVFSGIYKRIHRALKGEMRKLYRLNGIYLSPDTYFRILDAPQASAGETVGFTDYDDTLDVIPYADPNVVTETQRLGKAQVALQLAQGGMANPSVAARMVADAADLPNREALFQMPEPQPDPLIEVEKLKVQTNAQVKVAELELEKEKLELEREKLSVQREKARSDVLKIEAEVLKLRAEALLASEKANAVEQESRAPKQSRKKTIRENEDGSMSVEES